IATQKKAVTEAFVEADDQRIVLPFVPWTERVNCPFGNRPQESASTDARNKREVRLSSAQQVVHASIVIVDLDHQVLADFLLHTNTEAVRERCGKAAIDAGRQNLWRNCGVRQSAERPPEKESGCFPHSRTRLIGILSGSQTRERLDVGDID